MNPAPNKPRNPGVLEKVIQRCTKSNRQSELAARLKVTRQAVYWWNRGKKPDIGMQVKINILCVQHHMRPIYKIPGVSVQNRKRRRSWA